MITIATFESIFQVPKTNLNVPHIFISFSQYLYEGGMFITPILKMRKQKLRKLKVLTWGHEATELQSEFEIRKSAPNFRLLTTTNRAGYSTI